MSNAKIGYVFRVRLTVKDEVKIAYVPLDKFMIGSMTGLPVTVKDKSIESNHLLVAIQDNQIMLCDQQSTQGTWVNGRTLTPNVPYPYCPGDKITLGTSEQSLQMHLFVQSYNAELEPARIIQDAKVEAREAGEEMVKRAQDEIRQKSEEWTRSSRERMLAIAHQDAKAILEKADQEARRRSQELYEGLITHKKQAILDGDMVITEAEEQAKEILLNAERKGQSLEAIAEQKSAKIVRDGRAEAESIVKAGQTASYELKTNAHEQAQKIIGGAKQREETLIKSALDMRETQERVSREEITELRRKAESDITDLFKQVGTQAMIAREEARVEAEKMRAEALLQIRQGIDSAKADAEKMVNEARQNALEIERKAQDEAHARSHDAFQAVVSEAESRALALIQERDLRSQRTLQQATSESMTLLDNAREEAARTLQQGKLNAVLERSADVARALNEANAAADQIRAQARADADQILESGRNHDVQMRAKVEREMASLYQECHHKAELLVEQGRIEAAAAMESARNEARRIEIEAHDRSKKIVDQAQTKVAEIEEGAREQAHKDAEDQRVRTAHELFQMREQTQETYRLAKVFEADRRAQVENEAKDKLNLLDSDLKMRRAVEIGRIDLHWATKRRQDISILMRNLEVSWSSMRLLGDREKALTNLKEIVERSFAERSEVKAPPPPTWIDRLKDRSGMLVVLILVMAGTAGYLKRTTTQIPVATAHVERIAERVTDRAPAAAAVDPLQTAPVEPTAPMVVLPVSGN